MSSTTLKLRQEFSISFNDSELGEMGRLTIKEGENHYFKVRKTDGCLALVKDCEPYQWTIEDIRKLAMNED